MLVVYTVADFFVVFAGAGATASGAGSAGVSTGAAMGSTGAGDGAGATAAPWAGGAGTAAGALLVGMVLLDASAVHPATLVMLTMSTHASRTDRTLRFILTPRRDETRTDSITFCPTAPIHSAQLAAVPMLAERRGVVHRAGQVLSRVLSNLIVRDGNTVSYHWERPFDVLEMDT